MKCVKILRKKEGKLISFRTEGKASVRYEPGVFVYAPEWLKKRGYNLTIFESLEAAVGFHPAFSDVTGVMFWWAEAENITEPNRPYLNSNSLKYGKIRKVNCEWPEGTLFAEKIKLLRKVTREEFYQAYEAVFQDFLQLLPGIHKL